MVLYNKGPAEVSFNLYGSPTDEDAIDKGIIETGLQPSLDWSNKFFTLFNYISLAPLSSLLFSKWFNGVLYFLI